MIAVIRPPRDWECLKKLFALEKFRFILGDWTNRIERRPADEVKVSREKQRMG